MFEYFYNEILRKTIISFGTLFNGLTIKQEGSTVKVPLAYGPTQKFLARLEQAPNLSQATQISLPRMSFEFTGLTYDSSRKVTTTQTIAVKNPDDGTDIKKVFMPVPYNMQFELAIMCKLNDDALQIVEQILPYFQPDYTLTINDMVDMGIKRDIPIVLNSVNYEDSYRGDYGDRRAIIYTLGFTSKFYLYGPVTSSSVIKTVQVDQYTDLQTAAPKREQRYTVTPNPATADADDDFGFSETTSFFEDAKTFDSSTGEDKL